MSNGCTTRNMNFSIKPHKCTGRGSSTIERCCFEIEDNSFSPRCTGPHLSVDGTSPLHGTPATPPARQDGHGGWRQPLPGREPVDVLLGFRTEILRT